MFAVTIPKPCHEDWQKMTPTNNGAFCSSCAKEVIDFTNMSDDDVKNYLLNRSDEKLCGRFNKQQIDRIKIYLPANIFTTKMAGWKKFMAIVLIAFSSSLIGCDVIYSGATMGKVFVEQSTLTGDTNYVTTGVTLVPPTKASPDSTDCNKKIMGKLIAPPLEKLTGTVVIIQGVRITNNPNSTGMIKLDSVLEIKVDTMAMKIENSADTSDCGKEQFY